MASSCRPLDKSQLRQPVPSDIDIAQSIEPLHISAIAQGLGLSEDDIDYYGKYKAKVRQKNVLDWATEKPNPHFP